MAAVVQQLIYKQARPRDGVALQRVPSHDNPRKRSEISRATAGRGERRSPPIRQQARELAGTPPLPVRPWVLRTLGPAPASDPPCSACALLAAVESPCGAAVVCVDPPLVSLRRPRVADARLYFGELGALLQAFASVTVR